MFSIMPREEKFFDLFDQAAALMVDGAKQYVDLLNNLSEAESRARNIKRIESDADEVTHKTVEALHKTFITPLDREDIYALISRMDDVLDLIEAAAERTHLYDIKSVPTETMELAKICIQSAEEIKKAVNLLHNLKKPQEIIKICVAIHRLENEADHVHRKAMANLFRNEPDTRQLIKHKEIFELLETATDRCEDVANIVEGIVLEYS